MSKDRKSRLELTQEQIALSGKLSALKTAMDKATKAYWDLRNTCPHVAEINVYNKKWDDWGSATCAICEAHMGWYCPESPDRACHYFTEPDGKSVKISGQLVLVPNADEHNPEYETDDCCLFCGAPNERK